MLQHDENAGRSLNARPSPAKDPSRKPAPLWYGELAHSVHPLSPRKALGCFLPRPSSTDAVPVYFLPDAASVPTVQKVVAVLPILFHSDTHNTQEHGLECMVWTTIAAMRKGEGSLFFSYRLGPQTVTTPLGTKAARISQVTRSQSSGQHRPTVRLSGSEYQLARAAHNQLAAAVHTINNELVRLVRDGGLAPGRPSAPMHTVTVNNGGIDIGIGDGQPIARVTLNMHTGRLEVSRGGAATPVASLIAALQHVAGLSGGACPPVTVRFDGQRMAHADALQRPGEPAEVFFLRVAQPEHLEEGLLRLATVNAHAVPTMLKHGAMQVLVATALQCTAALEPALLGAAEALLASKHENALPLLVQALAEQLACMEAHPPALYALAQLAAAADDCPEEVQQQLATVLAWHYGRVFVGSAAKDALRQTITPTGSATSTPTRAGCQSQGATPQRLQVAINRAALRSHPVGEESLSPIGSPAPLDRPGSHDASRGNSPGKAPPAGRVAVPRLSLPLPATQRPASAGMHRSTRRTSTNSHRNSPSLVSRLSSLGRSPSQREHSAPGGPSAELAALAQSLAQSLVAQDLTALIRAKRVTQGSRSSSPMARDAGGQGAFSARSTPAATPRPVGALDADIEPAMPVETAPPVPATGVTDPDLRRRCCVLESLRRLLGGHAPLDAATRQDTLLWLIHETLVASGDGEAAVHRALCLQLLQVLGGGHGGMRGRLDDTAKALEPQPSSRWLAAERTLGACVWSACQRLSSVLSSGMHAPSRTAEACRLLTLLRTVVLACPHPSLPRLVLEGAWQGMQLIKATLCDALPAREWPPTARQLLQGMVNLLTALLHTATEGPCAQRLLSLLFEDQDMASVWVGYAQHLLPAPDAPTKAPTKDRPTPVDGSPAVQEQLLRMVLAALRLSTRLPEPFNSAGACSPARGAPGACRRLTLPLSNSPASSAENSPAMLRGGSARPDRGYGGACDHPLTVMWPLMDPWRGLLLGALQHGGVGVQRLALATLVAAFEAPGNPFVMDKATVDGCVQRHFMQFAIRYHARTPLTSSDRALLRGHLAVLCALAKTKTEVVARRFYQLCVMDLCVHELSLECQLGNGVVAGAQEGCTKQPASAQRGSSAQGTPRRGSTHSTPCSVRSSAPVDAPSPRADIPPLRLGRLPAVPQWQQEPTRNTPPVSARDSGRRSSRFAKEHLVRTASEAPTAGAAAVAAVAAVAAQLPPESSTRAVPTTIPPRLSHSNRVHPLPEPPTMPSLPPALRLPAAAQPSQGSGSGQSGSPSWGGVVQRMGGLLISSKGEQGGSGERVVFTGDLEEDVERMLEEEERAEAALRREGRSVARDLDTDSETGSEAWSSDQEAETAPAKGPVVPRLAFDVAAFAGVGSPTATAPPRVPPLTMGAPQGSPASVVTAASINGPALLTAMEQAALGKGKMQLAVLPAGRVAQLPSAPVSYEGERAARGVYRDPQLHLLMLQLVLELSLTEMGSLDARYYDHLPLDRHLPNVAFVLAAHLNHPANAAIVGPLYTTAQGMGEGAVPLLKLLVQGLFQRQLYGARQRVARGAYAQVFRTQLAALQGTVALKAVDAPAAVHDRCVQVDLHEEVTILESLARCQGVPSPRANHVCLLYDYGCDQEGLYLVLKDYRCSLKDWRVRHARGCLRATLPLYLAVFQQALHATAAMASTRVVHYDIKADNLLLQPLPGTSDDAFARPPTPHPPFDLVLADFGESRRFHPDEEPITSRNRGTECIKSPEMLQVANATKKGRANFDRRRKEGAGAASDVWSLGCLLYELVVGDFLYHDPDWIRFFFRVTRANEDILPPDKASALRELPEVISLLEFILVRDPLRRPTVADVIKRVEATQQQLATTRYKPPTASPESGANTTRSTGSVHCPTAPGTARLIHDATTLSVCLRHHFATTLVPVAWAGTRGVPTGAVQTYLGGAAAATDAGILLQHGVTHALLLRSPMQDNAADGVAAQQAADTCRRAFVDVRVVQVDGVLASDAPSQGLTAQQAAQHLAALHAADPAACTALLYEGLAAQAAAEMAVLLQAQATRGEGVFEALTALLRARPFTVLQEHHLRLLSCL